SMELWSSAVPFGEHAGSAFLDTPTETLFTRGLTGANLDTAEHGTGIGPKKINHNFGNVFGRGLPTCGGSVPRELGRDTARHDVAGADIVVAQVLHHRFAETIQAELRSVVSGRTRKCIDAGQAADVENIAASALLHSRHGGANAIECTGQIGADYGVPVF